MGWQGSRAALRAVERLMEHPDGMTVTQLADELGMTVHGARERIRVLLGEGFLEIVKPGRKGPGGEGVYRLGPRFRSLAMTAAVGWREELVGKSSPAGMPAFPRERAAR